MVSSEVKKRMSQFVAERLEVSRLMDILKVKENCVYISEKGIWAEHPKKAFIFCHTGHTTIQEMKDQCRDNIHAGIFTAHIFLKDEEEFYVRLGKRAEFKAEKSLKRYSQRSLDELIHLRGLEKEVLKQFKMLSYYAPLTEFAAERIVTYDMLPVHLEYSHLAESDDGYGFAKNTVADDYKLPSLQIVCDTQTFATIEFDATNLRRAMVHRASFFVPSSRIFR